MADTEKLIDAVALILENDEPPTDKALRAIVEAQATVINLKEPFSFSEDEIEHSVQTLKARFVHRMKIGALFEAEDYQPWLENRQGDIDWYYWERYRKHLLTTKKFPPHVVRSLDDITDKVLDRIEDPSKEGAWARKGLIVGHVQSGKTANYAGLICKAADSGYQVIIVLAGLLNTLRNQTQERLDSDFMGWCTRLKEHIGVSRFEDSRRPVCFTTSIEDFKKATANSIAMNLDAVKEPVVFVLKKNKSTLENLHKWLLEHNKHNLRDYSMLLVDDEADHASVNTNKEDKSPTAINRAIRDVLKIFSRSSYVGYTATPFANIFIDPDNEDEMKDGELYKDLFPRDFILSLDPPDNYVGPHRIFTSDGDLDCVRSITDHEDLLPLKHKIDFEPEALPHSLKEAINCFILAKSIRILRGQTRKHYTMMINASRFTRVQNLLKGLVNERVKQLRNAIGNYAALDRAKALENTELLKLHETWVREYGDLGVEWDEIQKRLKEAVDPISVITVNSSSQDSLDYSNPDGRSVIAIGGLGLSRGLTLEGLLVSYFLRNSIMYDTLMQMGRWFGYREGHSDICRIYMTGEAEAWYCHIADATEELREDFRTMEKLKLTPLDFGLRVRSHPTSLIVTAKNKMRSGKAVPQKTDFRGFLAETIVLHSDNKIIDHNIDLTDQTIRALHSDKETKYSRLDFGHLWETTSFSHIINYIEQFKNHPESYTTLYYPALVEHLNLIKGDYDTCLIYMRTLKKKPEDQLLAFGDSLYGTPGSRTERMAAVSDEKISFKKNSRLGESTDEAVGLASEDLRKLQEEHGKKTFNPLHYRKVDSKKPLLIIHPLIINSAPLKEKQVVGYGLSFPGSKDGRRPKKLVEYVVNIPYWNKAYGETLDQEDELD